MSVVTLAQLQAEIIDGIDTTSSGWPDSTQSTRMINRSLSELFDLLVEQGENYFVEKATVACDTAYDWIAMPDGYYPKGLPKAYKLVDIYYPYAGRKYRLERMNSQEYEHYADTNVDVVSGDALRYIQLGEKIYFQGYPGSAFSLEVWYVPQCPELATLLIAAGEAFDSASWTKLDTARDIVTAHQLANPVNGRRNADALKAYTSNSTHGVTQAATLTAAPYNLSCFFKAGAKTWAYLSSSTASASCYFNLSTGVLGTATSCTGSIDDWGNGWYRCAITFTGTLAAHTLCIQAADADTDNAFAGDGSTISCYLFGAQLVADGQPSAYWSLTDSIDWKVPFGWSNCLVYDVRAHLCAREESDFTYWMARKQEARQLIINAAMTRNLGNPVQYQRVYRRRMVEE